MQYSISSGLEIFKTVSAETVAEIASSACTHNICTSVFVNGKRSIENFIQTEFIGLDFDNDGKTDFLSLEDAKVTFASFKHALLTTKSHQIEKNGVTTDRFRVLLFLETPITKKEDYYATWFWLKEAFPAIDKACKDPSRYWGKHREVVSVSETGSLIKPQVYVHKERVREVRAALPGERGELSKETLKFLEFGAAEGGRNHAVYKVARDFLQALYEYEEAEDRIIAALERNGVICSSFTEYEAISCIESAYAKEAAHDPRLPEIKKRAFNYIQAGQLTSEPDTEEDWIVKGLLIRGGVSILGGQPKIGKTTLGRQLALATSRGEDFLGMQTTKGPVIHYSLDEKRRTVRTQYRKLGVNVNDELYLHFGNPEGLDYMNQLEEDILQVKPSLVLIDTLFKMMSVDNVNDYGPIQKAFGKFDDIARRADCHIMFIHHLNKPNSNYGQSSNHSLLGSTAISGAVDSILIFTATNGGGRKVEVSGRDVQVDCLQLKFDKSNQKYSVAEDIEDEF